MLHIMYRFINMVPEITGVSFQKVHEIRKDVSEFMKSVRMLVNSWNPWVKQWFHEFIESFKDFMKSLVLQ